MAARTRCSVVRDTTVSYGGSGNDWLYGERGDDRLSGGAGNDILIGGLGRDVLTGGAGRDTFAFDDLHTGAGAAADLITDLGAGDVIDLLAADITHYSSSGEPEVGGVNVVFADNGNARVSWYALGSLREITVLGSFTDYDDFIDNHLRYYEDDHFGGVGTGPLIEGNVTLRGSIDVPEDHDYFRLAFDPDRLYTVTVAGAGGEPLSEPGIFLVDPEGEYINEDWGWEGNPAQIQIAGGSGIYALGIWSVYFNGAGDYRLNVTSVAYQDDFGGWDDADHGRISVGKTKSGNIGHMGDFGRLRLRGRGRRHLHDPRAGCRGRCRHAGESRHGRRRREWRLRRLRAVGRGTSTRPSPRRRPGPTR